MTTNDTVTLLQEAAFALRRLEDFAIERKFAGETPDRATPQRALDVIREGMRLLSWSPYAFRRAELGSVRSREVIVPFGGTGYTFSSRSSATSPLSVRFGISGMKTAATEAGQRARTSLGATR